MAHWTGLLLCTCENWSLDPQNLHKCWEGAAAPYTLSIGKVFNEKETDEVIPDHQKD